jgi:aromatic ring-cleaving dioxygenase
MIKDTAQGEMLPWVGHARTHLSMLVSPVSASFLQRAKNIMINMIPLMFFCFLEEKLP